MRYKNPNKTKHNWAKRKGGGRNERLLRPGGGGHSRVLVVRGRAALTTPIIKTPIAALRIPDFQ